MNLAIIDERQRALKRRNNLIGGCRFWFPAENLDFPEFHDPEFASELVISDPRKLETIVSRSIDADRLH